MISQDDFMRQTYTHVHSVVMKLSVKGRTSLVLAYFSLRAVVVSRHGLCICLGGALGLNTCFFFLSNISKLYPG